jgi:four helix bundle protein
MSSQVSNLGSQHLHGGSSAASTITITPTTTITSSPARLFPHERLEAWRQARAFYLGCGALRGLPKTAGHLGDQLERAGLSVVLNIVEGAGRTSWKEKRHFFSIALGSLAESVAVLDLASARGLVDLSATDRLVTDARRVGALLTGLMKAGPGVVG